MLRENTKQARSKSALERRVAMGLETTGPAVQKDSDIEELLEEDSDQPES
jgi:hypothetical protein